MEAISETNPVFLSSLLGDLKTGKIQLPDFQRGCAVESRHARDLPEVLGWIREGAPLPTTVRDSNFNPHRLLTLRTRNSAAYKGIYALLDKVAVDRVRNQEYVVPGDGSEDDRCGGQDAVYDEWFSCWQPEDGAQDFSEL